MVFWTIEFLYCPESDWPNLEVGDNFTFSNSLCTNLLQNENNTCLNYLTACIASTITDSSNTSSCFSETGFYVNNTVNNLVDPTGCLISTSDPFGISFDLSTCSTSNMTNVSVSKIININKYSSLSKLLGITSWVFKAKDKFLPKVNKI